MAVRAVRSAVAGPSFWRRSAGGVLVADPTQLPEATSPGQTRSGTYGRSLSAGQTYVDPVSGVTVLKVTSSTVPISNSGVSHGYATSGPRCSQPWVDGGDGHTKYTLCLDFIGYFVDIDYEDFQAENFRDAGAAAGPGDAGMAFSLHPSTPQRSYALNSGIIRAYSTITGSEITPTGFPFDPAGAGSLNWLQTQLNDTWFAYMSGTEYRGYKPSTGTERAMTQARSGFTHDELHIDLLNPYVYMSVDDDAGANAPWNLEADTFDASPDSQTVNGPMSDDHCAPGRGYVVGTAHFASQGGGCYVYRADTDVAVQIIEGSANYHDAASDFYTNANWCRDLRPEMSVPADLWHLTSKENQDDADAKVRQYAMALVKNDGSSVRIVGHHDSSGSVYDRFSKAMLSPDGKLVIFTSDMNGSSRWDVFVAKMPVS